MFAKLKAFDDALDEKVFDEVGEAVGHGDRTLQAALEGALASRFRHNRSVAREPHTPAGQTAPDIGDDGPVGTGNEAQTVLGRQRLARERTGTLGDRLIGGASFRVALSCVDTHTRSDRSFDIRITSSRGHRPRRRRLSGVASSAAGSGGGAMSSP